MTKDLSSLRLDKAALASRPRRGRRIAVLAILVVAIAAAAWTALRGRASGPEVETMTAPPPARPEGEVVLTATGYVVARRKAAVSTKIPGRLAELRVEEGSPLRAGDVIARLEDSDLRASLGEAEARLAATRAEAEQAEADQRAFDLEERRLAVLHEQGLGTRQDAEAAAARAAAGRARIAAARSRIAANQAAVAYARATLENTVVRAPFDGVVLTKDAEVGESVAPAVGGGGTTRGSMVTMADMASLEVEADVGEANIAQLSVGLPAEIVLDAFPDRAYPGALHQIVPTADRQRATVQAKVRFTGETAGALPEMSAKVNFLREGSSTAAPRRVVTLPESAVRRAGSGWVAYRLDGGVAREVPLTLTGEPSGGRAEVLSGLSGGEEIVLDPPPGLAPGTRVRVKAASRR